MTHFSWANDILRLKCKLQPNASANKFGGIINQELKVLLTSPPVDGKANAHLQKFVSKAFGVAKSAVSIASGELNQHKTLEIIAPKILPPETAVIAPLQQTEHERKT